MFELILADFAKSVGTGANKRVVLQIDNAGWHGPENLSVPDGIRLVFQPAYSPELQPAEHLWAFVDEPLANCCFATIESLDQAVSDRCVALIQQPDTIRDNTLFHWWPCQRARSDQSELVLLRFRCLQAARRFAPSRWIGALVVPGRYIGWISALHFVIRPASLSDLLRCQTWPHTAIMLSNLSRFAASAALPLITTWPRSITANWSQTANA
jgi:hypothetical protein